MSGYANMYLTLFHSQIKAIEILQKAQQDAEDMYISTPGSNIMAFDTTMYKTLFISQTKVIEILEKAQQETEDIYINS